MLTPTLTETRHSLELDGDRLAIIDWNDPSRGCAAMDVARATVVLLGAALDDPQLQHASAAIAEFHAIYLDRYFSVCPDRRQRYEQSLPHCHRRSTVRSVERSMALVVETCATPLSMH